MGQDTKPRSEAVLTTAATIRAELARRNISGAQLAVALNRSKSSVNRLLTGEVAATVDDLTAIARVLGLTVSQLVENVEQVAS